MEHDGSPVVYIIDEDAAVRDAVALVLHHSGFDVEAFASAEDFFASADFKHDACLVTETPLRTASAPDMLRRLRERGVQWPVIVTGSDASVRSAVSLLQAGAFHVLQKPFGSHTLLRRVEDAFRLARNPRGEEGAA